MLHPPPLSLQPHPGFVGPRDAHTWPRSRVLVAAAVGGTHQASVARVLGALCGARGGNGTLASFEPTACSVVLFVYDESDWRDVAHATGATVARVRGQMKWWYVKRFLHPDLVPGASAGYSHVVVLDEDVTLAPGFDASRFFSLAAQLQLDLVQPAHDAQPAGTRLEAFLVRDPRRGVDSPGGAFVGYRTNFVECGPFVAVSARAWPCVWKLLQPDLVTGYG